MVHGYKVFNYDWTCRGKQYTCPGEFEEDVELKLCMNGMHFCERALDCFDYYEFDPQNHVAEVIAYGDVVGVGDKKCTNKLKIVREIPWDEVQRIVNYGANCTGIGNIGANNTGNYNYGERNTGDFNGGKYNTGRLNVGNSNVGNYNIGSHNIGACNIGDHNTGNFNIGSRNTGDWNTISYSSGCFNTVAAPLRMFNRPSDWTYDDWLNSSARGIMNRMHLYGTGIEWINENFMTEEEKMAHPEYKVVGGYIKESGVKCNVQEWWNSLAENQKQCIYDLPNFDTAIFKKCTGIDTGR